MSALHAAPEALEVTVETTDQLPGGKEADGIVGDFILRNDRIEVVISGNRPLRRANMSTFYGAAGVTPGCLYDLTLRGSNNDQITIFAPADQRGEVSWVRVVEDGPETTIETVVTAASNGGLFRRHRYQLQDEWQGVLIETTLRNEGPEEREVNTDDRWTVFQVTGDIQGILWADAVDPSDRAGYAYALVGESGQVRRGASVQLQPGTSVTYQRFLAVGESPAQAVGVVANRIGEVGSFRGSIRDSSGGPVTTARVLLRPVGATNAVACAGHVDEAGQFDFKLPPGSYDIVFADPARGKVRRTIEVNAGAAVESGIELGPASGVALDIRDAAGGSIPCKVQFHGVEGTPSPNLGPQNRAHGCVDQYHSEKGQFRVPLPPGRYRIVVTRGIEFGHLEQTVTVEAGNIARVEGTLRRLVDTAGWVSADYHNHSTPSGDNTCGTDDRIINLAAEHIEFAPTTEHNRFYDWRPHIDRLGLRQELQTVPGIELTGSGPHLNAFPFHPEPFRQDNGAPVWNPDPRISAITLRDWQGAEPDRWIQINHPDMVHNFIDRDGDGRSDGGFEGLAQLIDGIETQNYRGSEILWGKPFRIIENSAGKEQVLYVREFIWLQMLNRGHRYAAMAVNDAHSVYGNGVGGWRMYMPSSSDHPAEIDWRENCRHAKAGRSILTTGPFLQVETTDGILPGGQARGPGGVTLHVKVQCTDWIDIDRVQVLANGRPRPDLNFTRQSHPEWFESGVVKFERSIPVSLREDTHLIVVACSETSDLSKGFGTSDQASIKPCAYHNPIFVDVDGGGFTPNGDRLDWPLPVKRMSVQDVKDLLAAHSP